MDRNSSIAAEKKALRAYIQATLGRIPPVAFAREGELAAEAIIHEQFWTEARTVFAFLSMNGEIVSDFLVSAALREGKFVALPRVQDGELSFRTAHSLDGPWAKGSFGIREPMPDAPIVDIAALSGPILVIAPGVAFDSLGGRLGHGKGYYDRFLSALRERRRDVFVAALGVDEQLVERVPVDEEDERVDAVCTGRGCRLVFSGR